MRKIATLFALILTMAVLVACGSENKVVYELNETGMQTQITYYAKGDKVKRQVTDSTLQYEPNGISSKEEAQELVKDAVEELENTKGITYSINFQEDEFIEKIDMVLDEISKEDLIRISDGAFTEEHDYISLKESMKLIEQQGFKKAE